jgi:hypothetical protein
MFTLRPAALRTCCDVGRFTRGSSLGAASSPRVSSDSSAVIVSELGVVGLSVTYPRPLSVSLGCLEQRGFQNVQTEDTDIATALLGDAVSV